MKDVFCAAPFAHFAIDMDGSGKLCCATNADVHDEEGRSLSLYAASIADIRRTLYMQKVRQAMAGNKAIADCNLCYRQEALNGGTKSMRTILNDILHEKSGQDKTAFIMNGRHDDYREPPPLVSLHLTMGNECNLKCRMCGPANSSLIARDEMHSKWWRHGLREEMDNLPLVWRSNETDIMPRKIVGSKLTGFGVLESLPTGELVRQTVERTCVADYLFPGKVVLNQFRLTIASDEPPMIGIIVSGMNVNGETTWRQIQPGRWQSTIDLAALGAIEKFEFKLVHTMTTPIYLLEGVLSRAAGYKVNTLPMQTRKIFSRFSEDVLWHDPRSGIVDEIIQQHPTIRYLKFAGGEPLLHKSTHKILAALLEAGRAKDMTLEFITNGTILSAEMLETLHAFKHIHLNVSLEGFGASSEYIRFPSKWSDICNNIARLKTLPNITLYGACAISIYDVFHLVPLINWLNEENMTYYGQPVLHPRAQDVGNLPPKIKNLIYQRLLECLPSTANDISKANLNATLAWIKQIKDKPAHVEHLNELIIMTNDFDRSRKQNFAEINGELLELLAKDGVIWHDQTRWFQEAS